MFLIVAGATFVQALWDRIWSWIEVVRNQVSKLISKQEFYGCANYLKRKVCGHVVIAYRPKRNPCKSRSAAVRLTAAA